MKNKPIIILIVAAIIIGGGFSYAIVKNNNHKKLAQSFAMQNAQKLNKDKTADAQLSPANATSEISQESNILAKGSYSDYDPAKLANAQKAKVVLNFSAPWCPICREADKNFKGSPTPDGLTLLKVDYDSSTELKKKYGVTYQHTFVQVDKNGKLLKKWSGSTTYDELQQQII